MARATAFVGGLVLGVVLGTAVMVSHADPASADVQAAAEEANVQPSDLLAAMDSTGIGDPFRYLRAVDELPQLAAPLPSRLVQASSPAVPGSSTGSARVECIIVHESRGDPSARNRSGASGLGQFLPGTWASTPQGRAGYSVFNAAANRAAIAWMLSVGRAREFVAVSAYGC